MFQLFMGVLNATAANVSCACGCARLSSVHVMDASEYRNMIITVINAINVDLLKLAVCVEKLQCQ